MADSDYAIEPFWWAQGFPTGINGARSWTLHIINRGRPFDLSDTSMSIVLADRTTYPLDLQNFIPSMFNHGAQLDFQTIPSIPEFRPKMQAEIHCDIRGANPGSLRRRIAWKGL